MNEVLKQRLVGALILVALGVVFWPIIFVEPGDMSGAEGRRIPAHPEVDTTPIPAPKKDDLRQPPPLEAREQLQKEQAARDAVAETASGPGEELASDPEAPSEKPKVATALSKAPVDNAIPPVASKPKSVPKKSPTRTEAPVKPEIDADGVPVAWILQVASVSDSTKAEALRKRLLDMGHKAYVKKVHRSGKVFLRVYIGPKFERAQLEKIQSGINSEFGVQSMVIRYLP